VAKNDSFFESPKPAAALKHGVLRRYLRPFVQLTGSTSDGGRVAYLDGYAGPGEYDDGSPGSPAVAVDIAKVVVDEAGKLRIDGYFVEENVDNVDALKQLFLKYNMRWPVFEGDVKDHLPSIVKGLHPNVPLLAFLDPFGLGIPLKMIETELLARSGPVIGTRRTGGAATEVLLNFSFAGLRRRAGHLVSTAEYGPYRTRAAKR
jgi:three-Cys-motif partner protein